MSTDTRKPAGTTRMDGKMDGPWLTLLNICLRVVRVSARVCFRPVRAGVDLLLGALKTHLDVPLFLF